ncbi:MULTISPECIES: hypothetical protein [unclassified Streptomyces]|uniref:hypothetical protein n=1 Tax=unclassified Streptomyces TaxID=2593676 RepID=UPI0033E16A62
MTTHPQKGAPDATTAPGRPRARTALLNTPYGLTLREVRAEIRRCLARGWQLWEIRYRFVNDRKDTTE